MDNYSIKSVTFGGFDKQDVIQYIEILSKNAAAEKRELEAENQELRDKVTAMAEELTSVKEQLDSVTAQCDVLQTKLKEAKVQSEEMKSMQGLQEEITRLRTEVSSLRPDAKAFAQFRDRLGGIECEARQRADDLEIASAEKTKKMLESFQKEFQSLIAVFENTANYVNTELRKIEVNLTQLPRAMDQAGADLTALLEQISQNESE